MSQDFEEEICYCFTLRQANFESEKQVKLQNFWLNQNFKSHNFAKLKNSIHYRPKESYQYDPRKYYVY